MGTILLCSKTFCSLAYATGKKRPGLCALARTTGKKGHLATAFLSCFHNRCFLALLKPFHLAARAGDDRGDGRGAAILIVLAILLPIVEIDQLMRRVELVGQGPAIGANGMLKYKPKTAKRLYW
jgi:hypothetical protein